MALNRLHYLVEGQRQPPRFDYELFNFTEQEFGPLFLG